MYGSQQATLYAGPDHMTASAQNVYIHANAHLFVLTHAGDTVQHLTPEQLKTEGYVIDLRMMANGELLIAERQPARLQICDGETWSCYTPEIPMKDLLANHYKVLPDADGNTLYLTDSTKGGNLYKIDIAAKSIKPILENELSYANDIQMGPDGVLWIADSGNRRIAHIKLNGDYAALTGFPFSTKNQVSREGHTWPMMLQPLADGEWAVTQPTATGGQSDILIYKDAQTPEIRLNLDAGLDPTDLVIADGWLLASDIEGFSLYTVGTSDGSRQPWGDVTITDWLTLQKSERDTYQSWVTGGLILMIFCAPFMLVAGYFGTARKKRKDTFKNLQFTAMLKPSDAEVPIINGSYWLRRDPKMDKLFKYMLPAIVGITILVVTLLGGVLYLSSERFEEAKFNEMLTLSYIIVGLIVGMLPLVYLNLGIVRGQLGTDGKRIYVRYPGGSVGSAEAIEIIYTKFIIQFGNHTVSVGNRKRQALYQKGEVETYIAPLLKHGKKVSAFGLLMRQLAAGQFGQIYTSLYVFGAVIAVLYIEFWR